jgi:hypothetical protein
MLRLNSAANTHAEHILRTGRNIFLTVCISALSTQLGPLPLFTCKSVNALFRHCASQPILHHSVFRSFEGWSEE